MSHLAGIQDSSIPGFLQASARVTHSLKDGGVPTIPMMIIIFIFQVWMFLLILTCNYIHSLSKAKKSPQQDLVIPNKTKIKSQILNCFPCLVFLLHSNEWMYESTRKLTKKTLYFPIILVDFAAHRILYLYSGLDKAIWALSFQLHKGGCGKYSIKLAWSNCHFTLPPLYS